MFEFKQKLDHQTLEHWRVVHGYSDINTDNSHHVTLQQKAPLPYGLQGLFHNLYILAHANEMQLPNPSHTALIMGYRVPVMTTGLLLHQLLVWICAVFSVQISFPLNMIPRESQLQNMMCRWVLVRTSTDISAHITYSNGFLTKSLGLLRQALRHRSSKHIKEHSHHHPTNERA
jgi:hypothetical protein